MVIVISLAPGDRGDAPAQLGAMLARSAGLDVVVAAVTPTPWPPSPFGLDEEFLALQEKTAHEALARAQEIIGPGVHGEFVVEPARSVSSGLLEVARRSSAQLVVLGSTARGLAGLVSLGGIAERLLHSLEVPVCFAPDGFSAAPGSRVTRITVGFGRADHDSALLSAAAARAEELGVPLRVACFAVRPSTALRGSIETDAEDLVVGEWAEQLSTDIGLALITDGQDPARVETVIGQGGSWREAVAAIQWRAGDVLAIGASTSAVSRFLLGSHASKLVRNSPVPVLTIARSSLEADSASDG